jgi:hypothetical protein
MSYDVYVVDEKNNPLEFSEPIDLRGGTCAEGGTKEIWLNITCNYGKFFVKAFEGDKGIWAIDGKPVEEASILVYAAFIKLTSLPDIPFVPSKNIPTAEDYWAPTKKNAMNAMADLLTLLNKAVADGVKGKVVIY